MAHCGRWYVKACFFRFGRFGGEIKMKRYVKEFAVDLLKSYDKTLKITIREETKKEINAKKEGIKKILNERERGFYTDIETVELLVRAYQ